MRNAADLSDADPTAALIKDLRAAVAVPDDFIAVAAHELRNPMTPILGQVQLLRKAAQREGASDLLSRSTPRTGSASTSIRSRPSR